MAIKKGVKKKAHVEAEKRVEKHAVVVEKECIA